LHLGRFWGGSGAVLGRFWSGSGGPGVALGWFWRFWGDSGAVLGCAGLLRQAHIFWGLCASLFTGLCSATAAWQAAAPGTPVALSWQASRPTGLASGLLLGGVRWLAAPGSLFLGFRTSLTSWVLATLLRLGRRLPLARPLPCSGWLRVRRGWPLAGYWAGCAGLLRQAYLFLGCSSPLSSSPSSPSSSSLWSAPSCRLAALVWPGFALGPWPEPCQVSGEAARFLGLVLVAVCSFLPSFLPLGARNEVFCFGRDR
jgi:hypothetical protein